MGRGLRHPRLAQHLGQAWHEAAAASGNETDEHAILLRLDHGADVAGSVSCSPGASMWAADQFAEAVMRLPSVPDQKPLVSMSASPAEQPLVEEGPLYLRRFELRNAWKTVTLVISTRVRFRLRPWPCRSLPSASHRRRRQPRPEAGRPAPLACPAREPRSGSDGSLAEVAAVAAHGLPLSACWPGPGTTAPRPGNGPR